MEKCIFGPIYSRRLGVSLGINLVPYKTCSLNCLYCECGETTSLTIERKEHLPSQWIMEELIKYASSSRFRNFPPLYFTFAGLGEPTLSSGLGKIVNLIKKTFPEQKIALITNGTLFGFYPELLKEVKEIDLIIPSLDAATEETFKIVNQPHPAVSLAAHWEGLVRLKKHFTGEIWLEVFILSGMNDSKAELTLLRDKINFLSPQRVQINWLDRPAAYQGIQSPPFARLKKIAQFLGGEVILPFSIPPAREQETPVVS